MSSAMKPPPRLGRGATRRQVPAEISRLDVWLNRLVTLSVTTALVAGGLALLITLLFG